MSIPDDKQQEYDNYIRSKDYRAACNLCVEFFDYKNPSYFVLWKYGYALRKNDECQKFIDVCRDCLDTKTLLSEKFIHVLSEYLWCLYNVYIKNYNVDSTKGFSKFLECAKFIVDHCQQLPLEKHCKNPYVLTVRKVIYCYKRITGKNYAEIINWARRLNVKDLSEQEFDTEHTLKNGKQIIYESPAEFYYSVLSKAYEKSEKYQECFDICKEAFDRIKKWNHRNDLWIRARMLYCECFVADDFDKALENYKKEADRAKFWFMYHKLANLYFSTNNQQEALLYASKALVAGIFNEDMMINLLYDLSVMWRSNGNIENQKVFSQAVYYYRKQSERHIGKELKFLADKFSFNADIKPNKEQLLEISKNYVDSLNKSKKYIGVIKHLIKERKCGFIKCEHFPNNIYFSIREVKNNKQIMIGQKVIFEASKDLHERDSAINISIEDNE